MIMQKRMKYDDPKLHVLVVLSRWLLIALCFQWCSYSSSSCTTTAFSITSVTRSMATAAVAPTVTTIASTNAYGSCITRFRNNGVVVVNTAGSGGGISALGMVGIIRADDEDFEFDPGAGGVRLATESVLQLCGIVNHKPGKADIELQDFRRFKTLTMIPPDDAFPQPTKTTTATTTTTNVITQQRHLLGAGIGTELYEDPVESTEARIVLAPADAVRDCIFNSLGSTQSYEHVVINFCGGPDLQVLEVLDSVKTLVLEMDVKTRTQISFTSLTHDTWDLGKAYLTVVGLVGSNSPTIPSDRDDGNGGIGTQPITPMQTNDFANGQIYFADGQYWTVTEENVETADS